MCSTIRPFLKSRHLPRKVRRVRKLNVGKLTLLLHLLLMHHLRMRVRRTSRHTLPAHLARHASHLLSRMLTTHSRSTHSTCTRLHAHHRPRLRDVWCAGLRRRVAHLLHLLGRHGLALGHTRVTVGRHARVHALLGLVCGHHHVFVGPARSRNGRQAHLDRSQWAALGGVDVARCIDGWCVPRALASPRVGMQCGFAARTARPTRDV